MKKALLLALAVVIPALLCGCACEHEWTEADCLTPALCVKCEETGAEALGHDWNVATCTEPETCTRCGAMQGLAPGHSYGDWTFGAEDMTHVCSVCSHAETTEIDRALYLGTLLPGHWDFFAVWQDDELSFAQQLEFLDLHLYFDTDGGAALTTPENGTVQGTWTFDSFVQDGDTSIYYFKVNCGEINYVTWLQVNSGSDTVLPEIMLVLGARKQNLYLTQYEEATEVLASDWGITTNKWGSPMGNMANWLTFREDRTVTGYLNGPLDGVWHLVPLFSSSSPINNPTLFGIWIAPYGAEKEEWIQATLSTADETTLKVKLDIQQTFAPITAQDFKQILAARQIVLGTWTSTDIRYMGDVEEYTTDYSVTFQEDGTLTANFGKEQAGTWAVSDIDGYYGYDLYFDGHDERVYCNIDSRNTDPEDAVLSIYGPPQMNDRNVYFARLNEEQAALSLQGPTLPVGNWISTYVTRIHNTTREQDGMRTRAYSLSFNQDGTFTAMLDTDISGTWEYKTMHLNDDSFEYWLYIDDTHIQMFIDEGRELYFWLNDPNDSDCRLRYQFEVMTEEKAAYIDQGPAFPIGTWRGFHYSIINTTNNTLVADAPLASTAETFITFNEDGTLTASLDQRRTGTWEYIDVHQFWSEDVNGNRNYYYSWEYHITFQGEESHQQILIHCDGNMPLSISVPNPENKDQTIIFQMSK